MSAPVDRARETMHVRWDTARERRVLSRTLDRCDQVVRRRRAALWVAAAAAALVLLRVLPRIGSSVDESGGFAGAAEPSRAHPASAGHGGNAGTG
jgi:hypothetical protein